MNKIYSFLQSIGIAQPDKLEHFVGAMVLVGVLTFFTGWIVGILGGAALAWGKERYDKAHADKNTWDGWDAFATLLGGITGAVVVSQLF